MRHIQERLVHDPSMSASEFEYRFRQELDRAEARNRRPNPDVGKVKVAENAMTRLGALCFIRRRTASQERAGETFKSLYESCYGGGAPAVDAGRVQVDTTIMAHDNGAAAMVDRARKLRKTEEDMGKAAFNRLIALLIFCEPVSRYAPVKPDGKPNERHVKRLTDEVLADLDVLAGLWGFGARSKAA